ncbi:xin actin-binding repeat-containing protein 1-like [Pseudophryne corroboree]|uniref:xin actin-binding repeat-containing protein 1-like n=1 Tax=Pseudophryne corroboree TaxID=495146 RepID=UPI0030812717
MENNVMKLSKEANSEKRIEADLPLPPPPESTHPSVTVIGAQEQSFMPPPPPKETFSKFYEQRQVNELKRLYRHMHPELRKNLEHVVTRDISELLSTDESNQQGSVNLDSVLPGEVQSMRWIFENWNLDTIGEHQGSRKLTEEEAVLGGNVKNTSRMFQGQTCTDGNRSSSAVLDQSRGDVKTALWLFETQPLNSLNKTYQDDTDVQEAVLKDPIEKGDVKGTKVLFETQSLDEVGRCNSIEENSILHLKSEIQELKGDVNKTIKLFQTEPLCAIRDTTGNIHEIKSICREDTQSNSVNTSRWLFETQPLDAIHKDTSNVQLIRGISLEEIAKGGVNAAKWIFETQPLDTIKEHMEDGVFQASVDTIQGVDVSKQSSIFEKQSLDSINSNNNSKITTTEDVFAGDVKSTLWLFETQPMETLKGNFEVGQLKKVELLNEEKGNVKQRKHIFETCSLDKVSNKEDESREQYGIDTKEIIKGDVKSYKNLFETLPLDNIKNNRSVHISNQDDIKLGNVKAHQTLFETTPLYAIEDSLGNYHEVTSVSREQVISGDVKKYQWMFETKPLDQCNDSVQKVDIIKGITKQEVVSGDVATARWLFETQPVDVIHQEKKEECAIQKEVLEKGDVKKCQWLFETQPIDMLYDKSDKTQEKETLVQGNVKSYTWMFESQPLDSIRDSEGHYIKMNIASQDNLEGVNVKTTKHLFETEPLDSISSAGELKKMIRYSSRVEIQSGEVSRVKEVFESKPKECVSKADITREENIQAGSVNKFTWLFENCAMDSLIMNKDSSQELPPKNTIQGGDVGGENFIFETYSLDQIQQDSQNKDIGKVEEALTRGDVKSCTMRFETMPLYAIQDQGGEYHEVTSVKKEEIQKGDVRGAKWLFETKPLDRINKDEEVFVIRAVTQEDIEKGCVKAARWRFETEPLDSITDIGKNIRRTVDDIQKGDIQLNKQLFESQQVNQKKYVRLVSVSDVQKGNVRTSTWLFENQPIDSLKGEDQEHCGIIKVQREDNQKGDVKRCTWLFESEPLDSLKDTERPAAPQTMEDIPKANVKSTTWLFESTPLDEFDFKHSTSIEQKEISVKDILNAFFSYQIIQHAGIVIENINGKSVNMIKYQLSAQTTEIQKEETVGGNLQRILLQLLHRADVEPHGLLVEENSSGQLHVTKMNLLDQAQPAGQEEEYVNDDIAQAFKALSNEDDCMKTGIIMEESASGSVKIIIYSISSHCTFSVAEDNIVKGDVKSTIGNLLACSQESKRKVSVTREQNEKGNVQLYTSCIEKGDLGYLRSLQAESEIEALTLLQREPVGEELNEEQHKQTANQSNTASECVYVTSNPVFNPVQPQANVKGCIVVDTTKDTNTQKASLGCKEERKDITVSNTIQRNTALQKSTTSKNTTGEAESTTLLKECHAGGSMSSMVKSNSASETDLQAAKETNTQKASLGCKVEKKKDITVSNTIQHNTALQKSTASKNTTGEAESSTLLKECHAKGSMSSMVKSNSASDTDLQAALLDLKQATAEAKSIQQAQCKLQKSTQEIQLSSKQVQGNTVQPVHAKLYQEHANAKQTSSVTTKVQDTRSSYASLQKSTTSTKKVSVSEEQEQKVTQEHNQICRAESSSIKDGVEFPIQTKNYLNPFVDCDYKTQLEQEERDQDIVRGDVKAAIRALQYASTEQKEVEKEEVVRGNLTTALQSLQKSNVNVSKGDFKAAMIYRNAGQSYAACKKKSDDQQFKDQAMVTSVQSFDNDSPPSPAAVTGQERCQPPNTSHLEATKVKDPTTKIPDSIAEASDKTLDNTHALSTSQPPQRQKPALPPKPKHLLPSTRPPLRHKAKTSLTSPSSPSSNPLTKTDERSFKTLTDSDNMSIQVPYACDAPAKPTCIYLSANASGESEKEMLIHNTHMICNERHMVTSENQTSQDERTIQATKNKEDSLSECCTFSANDLKACTASLQQERQMAEEYMYKQTLCPNSNSKDEAPKKSVGTMAESRDSFNQNTNKGVVMRVKQKRETEDERRKRLSVHRDEILKDNVKAATDIFENLRKQDELQMILKKVKELEEETKNVDVKSMRGLFETVPDWIVNTKEKATPLQKQKESHKDGSLELLKEDAESVSSVELAFEDLEKASAKIKHLKEQTLARLLDIEETIKKALFSVSNLKSDSDIASLSCLFRESLGTPTATNNIRKISIVSSKAKPIQLLEEGYIDAVNNQEITEIKKTGLEVANTSSRLSPTSPSFITIESAARKPTQQNGNCSPSVVISNQNEHMSQNLASNPKQGVSGSGQKGLNSQECSDPFNQWSISCDNGRCASAELQNIAVVHDQNAQVNLNSPSSPNSQRQKSVLELKTASDSPKVIGTTIVTEKYEESDQYGNKTIRSKTSTTVTKQSDTQSSSTFEFVSAPPRYEVTASPLLRRHLMSSVENSSSKANETGVVFVTFGNSKPAKK